MAQSFCQLYGHLIFSTKHRRPWLDAPMRPRVHAYLATLVRDMGCLCQEVGGTEDHIHILLALGKDVAPKTIPEKIKMESSKFVKTLGDEYRDFYWQGGYGMFSVGPTRIRDVKKYIQTQEEHHKKMTFQEEFVKFLKAYGIPYDEKYLWD